MSENKPLRPQNNAYASAAGTYDQNARNHTPDQRELEARVLLKSAKTMRELQDRWAEVSAEEIDDVLRINRQIWLMFVDTAVEDQDPKRSNNLRNNIANLGVFIFNRTIDILSNPAKDKFDILIEINREVAAGLMAKDKAEATGDTQPAHPTAGSSETHKAAARTSIEG